MTSLFLYNFRWLETVLIRSVHHLKTIVRRIDNSEKDLATKMKSIHAKLTNLRQKSSEVIQLQRAKLKAEKEVIIQAFREELKKPQVQFRLCHWLDNELPTADNWDSIKKIVRDLVIKRILDEFCKWEEEAGRIESVQKAITFEIKTDLHILQEDLEKIENDLRSETSSLSDEPPSSSRKASFPLIRIGRRKSITSILDDDLLDYDPAPVRFVSKFLHPVDALKVRLRDSRLYDFAILQRKVADYKKDPRTGARKISEKFLQSIINPGERDADFINDLVENNLEKPKEVLDTIEKNIPALIESDEQVMDHISTCRVNQSESRELYESMMTGFESLKGRLIEYGTGVIYVDDFIGQRISLHDEEGEDFNEGHFKVSEIILNSSSGSLRRNVPRGLWTMIQNGYLSTEDQVQKAYISIKVYLPLSGIKETYTEVTKLR